ncbi:HAD family hydrolase [Auraticoccus monumenti]|uniref:HAD family hydrolase n=1 Tax=Auraticoccus monumenti TaxID=675864 RepID=UPI0012F8DB3D|nr:HAD family hydrolase [Auraticoccus monumenti]
MTAADFRDQVIYLDLDNTLINRGAAFGSWVEHFCLEHQLSEQARTWWLDEDRDGYRNRLDLAQAATEQWGLTSTPEVLALAMQRGLVDHLVLEPGVEDGLQALRAAGFLLAIVTNGGAQQQRAKVRKLGLDHLVDAVAISGEVGVAKPDREIFVHAAALLNRDLGTGWMVGDSLVHDIKGGRRAGLRTIWVSGGRTQSEVADAGRPDLVVNRGADALSVLLHGLGTSDNSAP